MPKKKKNGAMTYARIPTYGFCMGAKKSIAKRKTKANSAAAASTMPAQLSQFWK
jgi:hypothetical protein